MGKTYRIIQTEVMRTKCVLRGFLLMVMLGCTVALKAQQHQPIKWHFMAVPQDAGASLVFTASLEKGWHVYSQFIGEGGPLRTSFTFVPGEGYTLLGKVKEESTPVRSYDRTFMMDIVWFANTAVFSQKIKLHTPATTVKGKIEYMVCSDAMCLPPEVIEFGIQVKAEKPEKKAAASGMERKRSSETKKEHADVYKQSLKTSAADPDTTTEASAGGVVKDPSMREADDNYQRTRQKNNHRNEAVAVGNDAVQHTSFWGLFLAGFLGGLAAIIMPCIFPMLPFTVGYFAKQGGTKRNAVVIALLYGWSIVVIYVCAGLLITVAYGADALNDLSTNGIFNIFFFLLLVIFAASFLGAFEITLPSAWANKADALSEKRKGFTGIFFMAATLALVSFSCTGPIIGTLLVQAAVTGGLLGPAAGMFGFSLALALPFTLFSMFPAWLTALPRSGSWLNSVKVVLGFLELALALKFLSNVDLAYHWGWFDREVFLVLWIVIFGLLGMYLLGKLRLPHDGALKHLSPLRLLLAILSLSFTLYMIPGLWGAPLKAIAAFLPPQQTQDFDLYNRHNGFMANVSQVPRKYDGIFHAPLNLDVFFDYEEGLAHARKVNKPVMIDFTGHACVNCRKMEATVWPDPGVLKRLRDDYVLVQLYVDDKTTLPEHEQGISAFSGKPIRTIGNKWSDLQASLFNTNSQPYYVLLNEEGEPLTQPSGAVYDVERFTHFLDKGLYTYRLQQ